MARSTWTVKDIPSLAGKLALVTGANSGIGYETTRVLADKGAKVILACRTEAKAKAAIEQLCADGTPGERLEFRACDLSSLQSVRSFATALIREREPIDLLINNAGVMALPRRESSDGFEMHIGTNHFGPFALTGLVLPHLAPDARVVTVSSLTHKIGKLRFDDLDGRERYTKWHAYSQSKLANLLFCFELQRRLEAGRRDIISVAAHPGYSATNIVLSGARSNNATFIERITELGNHLFAQSAAMGALPTLYAASMPEVRGGDYFGPDGLGGLWGPPARTHAHALAHDRSSAQRLWDLSVARTSVDYDGL